MKEKHILLLYHYYHHHSMVERMAASMKEYGLGVDVLCMDNLHLVRNSDVPHRLGTRLMLSFFRGDRKTLLTKILRRLFATCLLQSLMKQYDLVDFHVFTLKHLHYMMFCQKRGIAFDITLWGSDLMRATDEALEKKKWGFAHCRHIKCSENLHEVLVEKYATVFDSKVRYVYWGISDFEVIDALPGTVVKAFRDKLLSPGEDFLVTCGYNGSEGQNLTAIAAAIGSLPGELKKRSSFLFPMTYGATPEYLSRVRQALDAAGVHYTILDKYLPAEEIAAVRLASDVVVNIQKTDAFSGSLQGHLYCNNVLIIGEWLNYVPLDNAHVYYIKTTIGDIPHKLAEVLTHLPEYKEKCAGNHEKMAGLTAWPAVLPHWAACYLS